MKITITICVLISQVLFSQQNFISSNSSVGSFSRKGFGARGIALGNSASSLTDGNLTSYYNPAQSVFQKDNLFSTAYTFLSLDRSLNFLNFTRKFEFFDAKDSANTNRKPRTSAGISFGVINSGVSKIDGRDNQGFKKGDLSTSENQFFIAVSNRFSDKLAIGLSFKFYYYKLYEDVTSTGLGFDFGAIYFINKQLTLAVVLSDINSKYKWDTSPLFGTEGTISEHKFPLTKKLSLTYNFEDPDLILTGEYEFDNMGNTLFRMGSEYIIFDSFTLRGGIDNINTATTDAPIRPSLGFGYLSDLQFARFTFDYAFMLEPYSPSPQHVIGINIIF